MRREARRGIKPEDLTRPQRLDGKGGDEMADGSVASHLGKGDQDIQDIRHIEGTEGEEAS